MSCLRFCSTLCTHRVQMETHRILNFLLVLKPLWGGIRTLVSKRECCRLEISRFVLFHTKLIHSLVQMSAWNAFSPFTLCRLSSCLDADFCTRPRTLYGLQTCLVFIVIWEEKKRTWTGGKKQMNKQSSIFWKLLKFEAARLVSEYTLIHNYHISAQHLK